ncbi:MAG TPA: glycosyltransferase family 9 protein [Desulfobacteria bacterium]|nr:glycosyltransferase family 9 protein [Desulfobacteria bacterium]
MRVLEILVIRPGALGDTLLMLPALKELSGKATLHFAGREPGLGFIREVVFNAMDLERAGWHRLFSEQPFLSSSSPLPISKADSVLAFFKDEEGIIGQNLKQFFPKAKVFVFPAFPPKFERIHVARYLAECLESTGLPINSDAVMDEAAGSPLICGPKASKERDHVVFHPGSGDSKKNHPPDFWLRLFRTCMETDPLVQFKPTLLLGPAEAPLKAFFEHCEDEFKPTEILFCPEKEQLMGVLKSAVLYLGHDSGITHLSGLMGTPTVALFKGTNPIQWGPLGPHVRIIRRQETDSILLELVKSTAQAMVSVAG